jgi:hypothetical protein
VVRSDIIAAHMNGLAANAVYNDKPISSSERLRTASIRSQYSSRSRERKAHVKPSTATSTITNHTAAMVEG